MSQSPKKRGSLVEYLDGVRLRTALIVTERDGAVRVLEPDGKERQISRDLIMVRHPELHPEPSGLRAAATAVEAEKKRLAAELDLQLLWEVAREQQRGFAASELAELFFGTSSGSGTGVIFEALLNDRLFFSRRHMEFVPNAPEQVEKLRAQHERTRLRSEGFRKTQNLIRQAFNEKQIPQNDGLPQLVSDLKQFLENPSTRSKDLTLLLSQVAPELPPAETAFEILERVGEAPDAPRFALIGGVWRQFGPAAIEQARTAHAPEHPRSEHGLTVTIDDEGTREIDDALSCEELPDGNLRVRVHISLVADFVSKGSELDREASSRAATIYLPEATIRMLPEELSCDIASLRAGESRPVMTTEVTLSPDGELIDWAIFPSQIRVDQRLTYEQADSMLHDPNGAPAAQMLLRLNRLAKGLRERRRRAGAVLYQRREAKIRVENGKIDIRVLENRSATRQMVAEFMVLSNSVAARFASGKQLPIIYRVQPSSGGDLAAQRPRLSLYPEFHAGIGLDFYAQASSPIRRYADLVLQRQIVAALAEGAAHAPYRTDELMTVLANAEAAEVEAKELERRAKRYWTLRYLMSLDHKASLPAVVYREGATAELIDYAARGTLRGAPVLADETPVLVRLGRIDPLRGWLVMDYVGPADPPSAGSDQNPA